MSFYGLMMVIFRQYLVIFLIDLTNYLILFLFNIIGLDCILSLNITLKYDIAINYFYLFNRQLS